jgi:hypothetical protein
VVATIIFSICFHQRKERRLLKTRDKTQKLFDVLADYMDEMNTNEVLELLVLLDRKITSEQIVGESREPLRQRKKELDCYRTASRIWDGKDIGPIGAEETKFRAYVKKLDLDPADHENDEYFSLVGPSLQDEVISAYIDGREL